MKFLFTTPLFLIFFFLNLSSGLALEVPYLSGRVVDESNVLSARAIDDISRNLKNHEAQTSNQIAVLVIPTLQDEVLENYATKVFETWKLGKKGKDNGVLLLVALQDRKMRIEVGYGLEPTLTDAKSALIIRNKITPYFRERNYEKGIEEGVGAIVDTLNGTAVAEPVAQVAALPQLSKKAILILGILLFLTLIAMMPGRSWLSYLSLIPLWGVVPPLVTTAGFAILMLLGFLVLFPIGKLLFSRSGSGRTDLLASTPR